MEVCRVNMFASQTQEQRETARKMAHLPIRTSRAYRTDKQQDSDRRLRRNSSSVDLNRTALLYDCTINYRSHALVI